MFRDVYRIDTSGEQPEDRRALLYDLCRHTYGKSWGPNIFKQNFDWLESTDFYSAPASTKYHGCYAGGLFDHSYNVARVLLWLTNKKGILSWQRPESPIVVGILHDATKIDRYILTQDMNPVTGEMEGMYIWNKNHVGFSDIHGEDSVLVVNEKVLISPEEAACIRWHMGAYETENWKGYDAAIREYPNVIWTHTADMIASKLMEGEPML